MIRLLTLSALLCALWVPSALAQDAPDYKPLVGVWMWRPTQQTGGGDTDIWSAQLTIEDVSDTGLVTAVWKDPHWGTIHFTTQAWMKEGTIRLTFGGRTKYHLEYDKRTDMLIGPLTDLPPKYVTGGWTKAYFYRTR